MSETETQEACLETVEAETTQRLPRAALVQKIKTDARTQKEKAKTNLVELAKMSALGEELDPHMVAAWLYDADMSVDEFDALAAGFEKRIALAKVAAELPALEAAMEKNVAANNKLEAEFGEMQKKFKHEFGQLHEERNSLMLKLQAARDARDEVACRLPTLDPALATEEKQLQAERLRLVALQRDLEARLHFDGKEVAEVARAKTELEIIKKNPNMPNHKALLAKAEASLAGAKRLLADVGVRREAIQKEFANLDAQQKEIEARKLSV